MLQANAVFLKGSDTMPKFIPREKLGKKARRALDAEKRAI